MYFASFNCAVDGIRDWLKQMDLSLKSENLSEGGGQRGASDAAEELERMDNFYRNLRARRCAYLPVAIIICQENIPLMCSCSNCSSRDSIESLCQEAQSLCEAGLGSGAEVRVTSQLQVEHQALLKAARERLRGCQESQALGETLQGVWTWLEEIQERLGTVDSTMGTKEQLEQRLVTVQVGRKFKK